MCARPLQKSSIIVGLLAFILTSAAIPGHGLALSPASLVSVLQAGTPRWSPRPEDRANKSLMASYLEGDWTTQLGQLRIRRTRTDDVDHWTGHIDPQGADQPGFVLEDLVPSEDASGLTGTWREASSSQKRAIRLVLNFQDGDRFIGGGDGYMGGLNELSGTRIVYPPAYETPEPQQPQQPSPQTPQQPQQPTQPRPVPQEPQPQPEPPEDDFQPLGIWDVRVDKVENPREDRLTHVYVTLRNASTQPQLQTGDIWVYLEDSSGVTQRSGQGVRAIPGPPQLFGSPPPVTLPGKTIKAKYIFDRVKGASITRITVVEGDQQAEFEF